ncbi:MAG: bis-aminopropyl spermidine synthase family protein [Armatimonadota bacterium]|nr:bis-aminopropyl spermidine synthase family protein [Armatimonadota bacterium]
MRRSTVVLQRVGKGEPLTPPKAREMLAEILDSVRSDAPIPFTHRDAERALAALLSTEEMWEAVRLSRVPMRFLCAFWSRLEEKDLLAVQDGRLSLTEAGRELASNLCIAPAWEASCDSCEGRGVDFARLPREVVERFREISRGRPEALQVYDQGYVTEETTLARVAFALARGDLSGKEILVIGDDDLVSVAAALTGAPSRVLVVDIDDRLIRFIREVARVEGLDMLEATRYDIRDPLPHEWRGRFDTFLCDPTESFAGFCAFIERGLLAVRGVGSAGYFGLTHAESSLEKWAQIQRFLLESGAVITDIREDFNSYVTWGYVETMRAWSWLPIRVRPDRPWYFSSLFRIELLRPPSVENRRFEGNIFADEEAATV